MSLRKFPANQLINNQIRATMKSLQKAAGLAIVAAVMLLTINSCVLAQSAIQGYSGSYDFPKQAVTRVTDAVKFMDVYNEAMWLNTPRFKDINNIQVGDTVLFPSRTVGGTPEYWVADKSQNQGGKHDCIWRLTERYMSNTLPTKPAVIIMPPAPVAEAVKEDNPYTWWILIFAVIAIIFLYYFFRNNSDDYKRRQRSPDTHPPVVPSGLYNSPEHAAYQIAQEYDIPFNNIVSAQRVILVRDSGPTSWKVQMQFNDTQREVDVLPGETYTLITVQEGEEQLQSLFRNHCGNKTGTIVSNGEIDTERNETGEVILPTGWRMVKEEEYIRPVQSTDAKTNAAPIAAKTQETAAPAITEEYASMAPVLDNNFVPAIMKALPKNADNIDFQITATEINISVKLK